MWREVGPALAKAGQRVPRTLLSSVGPPPNGSFSLRCCGNRMTSVYSQDSSTSRCPNWIRAWHRVSCDDPFGRLNRQVRSTRRVKGGLDLPGPTTVASGLSRCRGGRTTASPRPHTLRRMAVFRLKMIDVSLCPIAQNEPSRGEQAPGNGRSCHRPLRSADRCVGPTKRRGWETGSRARKNRPASRYSVRDGPASHLQRHGHPASPSVPTRNSVKGRTARNHQGYPMVQRSGEQG
jgi:hypothetical protein